MSCSCSGALGLILEHEDCGARLGHRIAVRSSTRSPARSPPCWPRAPRWRAPRGPTRRAAGDEPRPSGIAVTAIWIKSANTRLARRTVPWASTMQIAWEMASTVFSHSRLAEESSSTAGHSRVRSRLREHCGDERQLDLTQDAAGRWRATPHPCATGGDERRAQPGAGAGARRQIRARRRASSRTSLGTRAARAATRVGAAGRRCAPERGACRSHSQAVRLGV